MNRRPDVWAGAGAAGGAVILINCGVFPSELPFTRELFALCLVAQTVAAIVLFRRGNWWLGALVAVVSVALLFLSLLPVYVEHWTPWSADTHRHIIWDLGHVH